jgi:hypothetical protein
MEPHKQDKYSKSLNPDEIEEVLLDEELEDRDEVVEPRLQSSSSSEDEDDAEETEVAFWAKRAGIRQISGILLGLQMALTNQLPLK